ncbi:unnamed protein product [Rhizophagus irregularis]|nr:unnamed protein product [Rhizophagus irregularis]
MSKTKDKCKNCADFDAKLDFTNRAIKIRKINIFKDNPEPFVLIIPPSVTGGDGPPGSPGGIVSETFSNNGTNKKQNENNENNELSENYDSQVSRDIEGNSNKKHVRESDEILEISDTNNTNEDFCSTLKNDKKRVKIGNTSICKKVTKPDKEKTESGTSEEYDGFEEFEITAEKENKIWDDKLIQGLRLLHVKVLHSISDEAFNKISNQLEQCSKPFLFIYL